MPFLQSHPGPISSDGLIQVGYITKAHGIRGEVVMVLQAESPAVLEGGIFVRPRQGGQTRGLAVSGMRRHHGNLLLRLEGVETRTDAELLRSHTVLVSPKALPPLEEDEVYLKDLPGLRVFCAEANSEREIGVISGVSAPAGQDIWTITTGGGQEILFPAVEEFVVAIELEKGRVTIAPPPGLLELYLGDEK